MRHWNSYNPREKRGIAKPAVFIIDQDRVVRYSAVDTVMKRVGAAHIVGLLQAAAEARRFGAEFSSHYCLTG